MMMHTIVYSNSQNRHFSKKFTFQSQGCVCDKMKILVILSILKERVHHQYQGSYETHLQHLINIISRKLFGRLL